MVDLLFSTHGRISRTVLAGPFVAFSNNLCACSFIEASVNNNPILMLMALALMLDCNLCHGQTAARYGCDGLAFDSCRSNSDWIIPGRCVSRHHRAKPIWSRSTAKEGSALGRRAIADRIERLRPQNCLRCRACEKLRIDGGEQAPGCRSLHKAIGAPVDSARGPRLLRRTG